MLVLGQVFVVDSRPAQASGAASRISWGGGSWYLHGANVPWYAWACDFGCGNGGGVSSSASRTDLASRFAQAQASGVRVLRWWTFEGDPWQINRDANGAPNGLNPAVYADFDAALQLAEQYDLYYDFVLFSGASALPSGWLSDATQRTKLASALAPLFARYNGNPRVLSWEVFNEPDFDVWGNRVTEANFRATVKAIADTVHARSSAYVTVGMGFADGLDMVTGLGLDYYQAHWYDYMSGGTYCMRCNTYGSYQTMLGLDAPLVVGEMYAGTGTDALQRFEDFYAKGYAGSWAWSLFPEKTSDKMPVDLGAAQTFYSRHADIGPRSGGGSTSPTATPSGTVTATATATTPTTQVPAVTYVAGATVPPAPVGPGTNAAIVAAVTSSGASSALVDVEIYSASGVKMYQDYFDNQVFTAGQQRTFPVSWAVPANAAPGTYTVVVGVFSPGWGTVYAWNAQAGTVVVGAGGANATVTSTPLPSATPRVTSTPTAPATATATPRVTSTPGATATATPRRHPRRQVGIKQTAFRSRIADTSAQSGTTVTISAGTTAENPSNSLREIRFNQPQNATIDIGTARGQRTTFDYVVPEGTAELSFSVTRVTNSPYMVSFTIVDEDGEWTTFVGEGS